MNSVFEQLLLDNKLIQAASHGDNALVEMLLAQGADIHAACDSAFRHAAKGGHTATVSLLLDRGADIHAVHDIALRSAAQSGCPETITLLLGLYGNSELQSLQGRMQSDLAGTNKLVPLLRTEIARRLVQKIIKDQPAMKI
jgi:ankyrin repeat protein